MTTDFDNPKPTWETAPEYAKYLARDYEGTWQWYAFYPNILDGSHTEIEQRP